MEAVTDIVFRHVVAKAARPDIFFTEFTNTASYFSDKGRHSTVGRLAFSPDEQPIIAQIWGTVPEHFAFMSQELAKRGFAGIDINMGCPAKDVVKTGGGSGLIKTPKLAAEIIQAAKIGGIPVSVKTRLGDIRVDEWPSWIGHLLKQGIDNLTIHLRTRKEMSAVPAHYELIDDILKLRDEIAPDTLITINGDIRDRQHATALAAKHNVDGIMIGRGIFTNPYAFSEESEPRSRKELLDLLRLHLDLFDKYAAETPRPYDPLKRFFKIYVRDFNGAAEMRDALMHTTTTDEARAIIDDVDDAVRPL